MSKYRFGWQDLILVAAVIPALTGHFYVLMGMLAAYALLYRRATRRRRR